MEVTGRYACQINIQTCLQLTRAGTVEEIGDGSLKEKLPCSLQRETFNLFLQITKNQRKRSYVVDRKNKLVFCADIFKSCAVCSASVPRRC